MVYMYIIKVFNYFYQCNNCTLNGIHVNFSAVQDCFTKGFNDAAVSEDSNISIQVNTCVMVF